MKYFSQTLAYLFRYGKGRRFITIFLISLVPSALLAYAFPVAEYFRFFFGFSSSSYPDFGSMWLDTFNHDTKRLVSLAISVVLLVLTTAYLTTVITRSIRVGEFRLTHIIHSINDNFFPASVVILFYFFTAFVAHNLFILLAYLFYQIKVKVFGLVLSILVFLGVVALLIYLWSAITLWVPTMSFSGQYVTKAFVTSFYKSRSFQRYFFLPALVVTAGVIVLSLVTYFATSLFYLGWVLNTIIYALTYTFILTFGPISYCDTEGITREDAARRYFGR